MRWSSEALSRLGIDGKQISDLLKKVSEHILWGLINLRIPASPKPLADGIVSKLRMIFLRHLFQEPHRDTAMPIQRV